MSKEFNLDIRPEPFWLQEAFACMNYVHELDSEEWLDKSNGWSRQRKEECLLSYRSYRDAMRARLQPVLAQYPLLSAYVDPAPRDMAAPRSGEAPIMRFLMQVQDLLESGEMPSEERLEAELNRAFQRMLDGNPDTSGDLGEEDSAVINSLPDMMAALENWSGTDADKFKLLRLYSERREVMAQLWGFQGACGEIGRECLEVVRERFHACMEEWKTPGMAAAYLEKLGIQCEGEYSGRATLSVMAFNRLMIQIRALQEKPGHFEISIHAGLEAFTLWDFREEDPYQDGRLLSRLKALSDSTRLKILHQLAERPCYLQEMAKALGLTPATVLHHVGVLMAEELIEIQVTSEKKKVYYQLRKQGLEEASQGILQLAMSREERKAQREQQLIEEQQSGRDVQWIVQKQR